ncbi:hypothetical protein R3P38DRAFT_3116863 [Favolaschia claudopus]|uniref:Nephrocystin 3-like N-terminal domain-containing protein n=1 Tax=Favolaschia claudopus TaxID=2862362 RepID=A0AAV9ZFN9_9AGAR
MKKFFHYRRWQSPERSSAAITVSREEVHGPGTFDNYPDTPSQPLDYGVSAPKPRPSKVAQYINTLKSGFVLILKTAEPFLEGTPFQIPISVLNTVIHLISVVADNNDDFEEILNDIDRNSKVINDAISQTTDSEASVHIRKFFGKLKSEMDTVFALTHRGLGRKVLESGDDVKVIESAIRRIDSHFRAFQVEMTLLIQRMLHRVQIEAGMRILDAAAANEASYDSEDSYSHPPCHPDTRRDYLSRLDEWSHNETTRLIWMHGPAGVGKSAIAQSFCESLHAQGRLGGSFFFKKGHPTRGNAFRLLPTLAYQLAQVSPEFKFAVTPRVAGDPALVRKSLAGQMSKLIIDPYCDAPSSHKFVIVIDGLDECDGEQHQQEILHCVKQACSQNLVVLVVSRPEPHICEAFLASRLSQILYLSVGSSLDDVRLYLLRELRRIRQTHESMTTAPDIWPDWTTVEYLVKQSSGHFVYATTVIKYIDDRDWDPQKRLAIVTGFRHPDLDSQLPFAKLDQLYMEILLTVPGRSRLIKILWIIALALKLSISHIAQFLSIDCTDVRLLLRRLHSVLDVPATDDEGHIKEHHKSFSDFLTDPLRSGIFTLSETGRAFLENAALKAFCESPSDGSLPSNNHVAWVLPLFNPTIQGSLSSVDVEQWLRHVNPDFMFARTGLMCAKLPLPDVVTWLKDRYSSEEHIQRWEDYGCLAYFNFFANQIVNRCCHSPSATTAASISSELLGIIHVYTLFGPSSLVDVRLLLDTSWEDLRATICPLRATVTTSEQWKNLFLAVMKGSPPVQSDERLQMLAGRCIQLIRNPPYPGFIMPRTWSCVLRACSPSANLLNMLQDIVDFDNFPALAETEPTYANVELVHACHILKWLHTFPEHPTVSILIAKLMNSKARSMRSFEVHKMVDGEWLRWKRRTGCGDSL